MDRSEFTSYCLRNDRLIRWVLRDIYNIILQLQRHIIKTASSDLLDDISLKRLEAKMCALQPGFQEVCHELGEPKEVLVWAADPWW